MTTTCPACSHEIEIGQWPHCPHEWISERHARRFDPIVVWQSNSDASKFSFPGQAGEAVPEGYHKIEISDLRQADQFVSRMNAIERARMEQTRDLNYQALDEQTRQRRADTMARIRGNPKAEALFRAAREWADQRREAKRLRHRSLDPHFHINVLSFDSGNRNSYSGPETGWREKKS
jgi:hypothetical protein